MGIEDKSPMLLVGEQEIEGGTLRDRLKNIFNNSLNAADLTPAEKRLVIDSFMTKAERAISHRAQAGESGGYFDRGLINWALSEAQSQIDQLIIDREKLSDSKKSEKRLCPELAGKTKTELDFNNYFNQLKKAGGEGEGGKKKLMVLFNFDLDDFKPKNDRYGHIVGDLILKAVGISLFEILRSTDVGSHFSGDEYGGILIVELPPNTKQTDESSAIKKIVSEVVDRVQKKTPETLEKLIKKAKEEAEEGTFPEDLTADTVFADGEQQVSTGYVIVRHDSHGAYSDFSQKADEGQKCSKMLKNLSIKTGHRLPGPGRVVDFAETKEIGERFSKKERAYMDAVGGCNRPIDELIATGLVLPNTNIKEKIAELIRTALEEGEK